MMTVTLSPEQIENVAQIVLEKMWEGRILLPGTPSVDSESAAMEEEISSEILAALAEAQAAADRLNMYLDSIHHEMQLSIIELREAHETMAAIRKIGERKESLRQSDKEGLFAV
jgi:hypothetical protein